MPELRELSKTTQNMTKEQRNLLMMEVWAKHALKIQAGNCAIQAALAFQYLRTEKKIFPAEVMQLRHKNHGFVILAGRPTPISRTSPTGPRTPFSEIHGS